MNRKYEGYGENCTLGFDNINDHIAPRRIHKGWFSSLYAAIVSWWAAPKTSH